MESFEDTRVPLGVEGLDQVMAGGLPARTVTLVQGAAGTGKTTLGLQFLREGVRRGERVLLISNSETPEELRTVGATHGWSLDGIEMARFEPPGTEESLPEDYTLFPAAEVEVGETMSHVIGQIERVSPDRLVIDDIAGLRLLARDAVFYKRQLHRLRARLAGLRCTTILLDDDENGTASGRTRTFAHGLVQLEQLAFLYGGERRRLVVRKLRGSRYQGGYHDFVIRRGGIEVFPRLIAANHPLERPRPALASGVPALDALTGGGLDCGTSTLLLGPAGTGKSTLASLYLHAAAERGEPGLAYLFDEGAPSYVARARALGHDLGPHVEAGRVRLVPLDPAERSPGQVAHEIRRAVEEDDVRVVVLDTLNGYLRGGSQEAHIWLHLRELVSFLARRNVVTLLVLAQHGLFTKETAAPIDLSLLSDTVVLTRFFEAEGALRKTVAVVKRRTGRHEPWLRELRMDEGHLSLGPPLTRLAGVLTGHPVPAARPAEGEPA